MRGQSDDVRFGTGAQIIDHKEKTALMDVTLVIGYCDYHPVTRISASDDTILKIPNIAKNAILLQAKEENMNEGCLDLAPSLLLDFSTNRCAATFSELFHGTFFSQRLRNLKEQKCGWPRRRRRRRRRRRGRGPT